MKRVFINYVKYDNEWISIDYIGSDLKTSVEVFKRNLVDYLESGPDDQYRFLLVCVDMTNKDYKTLTDLQMNCSLYLDEDEDHEVFTSLSDKYNFEGRIVCQDDHSGNLEIIEMYCEDTNLDPDDEDVYEEVSDLLWYEDDDLYKEYLNKYVNKYYKV